MLTSTMPEQSAERAKQAANYGMDWMRQLMEESLNQTRAIFDGFSYHRPQNSRQFRSASGGGPGTIHVHGNRHALELYGFCASGFKSETAAGPVAAADRIREQAGAGGCRKQQNARNHCARSVRFGKVPIPEPGGSISQIASRVKARGPIGELPR